MTFLKYSKQIEISQFMKRKSISASRSVENVSGKGLRGEVEPVQTDWEHTKIDVDSARPIQTR